MFPLGSRVRFLTTRGETLGTVTAVHGAVSDCVGEAYSVRPDGGDFPVMLLLGRNLQAADKADVPFVVEA